MQTIGTLTLLPALEHPDLLGEPVREALDAWEHAGEVLVAEIDPDAGRHRRDDRGLRGPARGERQLRGGDGPA